MKARQPLPRHGGPATPHRATKPRKPATEGAQDSLLGLQNSIGNRAVGRHLQRQLHPAVRDATSQAGQAQMEQGIAGIGGFLGMAGQLQGLAAQSQPGRPGPAQGISTALYAQLMSAGAMIDSGIRLYRKAGGRLKDIENLLKARSHLGSAAFYAQLSISTPAMAPQVLTSIVKALTESNNARVAEVMKKVEAINKQQGPITQTEAIRQQGEDLALEARYLLPFGLVPMG